MGQSLTPDALIEHILTDQSFPYLNGTSDSVVSNAMDWMDDGARAVFVAGAIMGAINYFNRLLLSIRKVIIFGFFWNYWDVLSGYLMALTQYQSGRKAIYHQKRKYVFSATHLFSSTQLSLSTTLAVLATKKILMGAIGKLALPLSALSFVVSMWISASIETFHLISAIRKSSLEYLLQECLMKYQKIAKKLQQLEPLALKEDKNRINALKKKQVRLKERALSIARVKFRDKTTGCLDAWIANKLSSIPVLKDCDILTSATTLTPPSETDKALVRFLKCKQYAKVRLHTFGAATWVLVALGMTFVMGVMGGVFFPPLMIPGIVIVCVAGILKLVEMFKVDKRVYSIVTKKKQDVSIDNGLVHLLMRVRKRQQVCQSLPHQLNKSKLTDISLKVKGRETISQETRIKIYLAFRLSGERHIETNESITEAEFTKYIMELFWWKRRTILNAALDKYIEQMVLLEENIYTKGLDDKECCNFFKKLSNKDRQNIVAKKLQQDCTIFRNCNDRRIFIKAFFTDTKKTKEKADTRKTDTEKTKAKEGMLLGN